MSAVLTKQAVVAGNVVLQALLQQESTSIVLTCAELVAGIIPAIGSTLEQPREEDDRASSQFSLGSDALIAPWFKKQPGLDMQMCCNMVCMSLAVLHRMKRYHTVVQV